LVHIKTSLRFYFYKREFNIFTTHKLQAMKKVILLSAAACMLAATTVTAQNFYLKAGAGYIFPASSAAYNNADPNGLTSIPPSTSISISADGSNATIKSLNGSLGTGYKFGLAGGYQFTKHIAAPAFSSSPLFSFLYGQ
jgi:hypothetical protein